MAVRSNITTTSMVVHSAFKENRMDTIHVLNDFNQKTIETVGFRLNLCKCSFIYYPGEKRASSAMHRFQSR